MNPPPFLRLGHFGRRHSVYHLSGPDDVSLRKSCLIATLIVAAIFGISFGADYLNRRALPVVVWKEH
jgi:hypothetical protein